MPRVTCIMTSYNTERFISEAIKSVLKQTYVDFELIIYDDGSTDNTYNIAKEFEEKDSRIKVFKNDKNLGIAATANRALDHATGEFITFCDSDDIRRRDSLHVFVNYLDDNYYVDIVSSYLMKIDENGKILEKGSMLPLDYERIRCAMLFGCPLHNCCCMIRRKVFDSYRYDENYPLAQDYKMFADIMDYVYMTNIKQPLVNYRVYNRSMSKYKKETELAIKVRISILERICPHLDYESRYRLAEILRTRIILTTEDRQLLDDFIDFNNKNKIYNPEIFTSLFTITKPILAPSNKRRKLNGKRQDI